MLSRCITTIVAAALSAYACGAVAQYGTPVDDALPLIAVVITILAAMATPAIQIAVPLLIGGEIVFADERLRLLWFGVVIAAAFFTALECGSLLPPSDCGGSPPRWKAYAITALAIILLRWIPLGNVVIWREVLLIAIALAIVAVLRPRAFSVAVGVGVALFTPLVPLRTIGFPLAVLVAVVILRSLRMPPIRAEVLGAATLGVMLMFFAWSGVFARALPLVVRGLPRSTHREPLRMALAPGEAVSVDLPANASAVILSGANMSRLRPGTVAGTVDGAPVRVGDVADWGFLRREHFYGSRNALPRNPAGEVRDYGQCAWVDGAARFPLPRNARSVRVAADPRLPPAVRLQIDSVELVKR